MSLFVAVRPDDEAVEDLQHRLESVRRLPAAEALRWQPPGQWHVTLAFLGTDDVAVADEVAERLLALRAQPPIDSVQLVGAGAFGPPILWMGLGDAKAVVRMSAIAERIPSLLRGSGADVDRRPWRPHLTIARARHGDVRPIIGALDSYRGPTWRIDEVLLVRSTGGPHPAHDVVASIALTGGPA